MTCICLKFDKYWFKWMNGRTDWRECMGDIIEMSMIAKDWCPMPLEVFECAWSNRSLTRSPPIAIDWQSIGGEGKWTHGVCLVSVLMSVRGEVSKSLIDCVRFNCIAFVQLGCSVSRPLSWKSVPWGKNFSCENFVIVPTKWYVSISSQSPTKKVSNDNLINPENMSVALTNPTKNRLNAIY